MKKEIKHYIFDIDGTFCHQIEVDNKNYYISNQKPDKTMINIINSLYDKGNKIIIMTGRGSNTGIDWKEETEKQLKIWGVKYHKLKFIKKPLNYMYVDDCACSPKEFKEKCLL